MSPKSNLDKQTSADSLGIIPSGKKNNGKRLSAQHPYLRPGFQFKCCEKHQTPL